MSKAAILFGLIACASALGGCGSLITEVEKIKNKSTSSGGSGGSTTTGSTTATTQPVGNLGTPAWARTITTGPTDSSINGVATDASGNIYVAGSQFGTGTYTYGGQSATGTNAGNNVALVKYDSSGTPAWAKTVSAGASNSVFNAVATDSSGNVYAVGFQNGTGSVTYAGGASVMGGNAGTNAVLVKFSSSGIAIWARSVAAGAPSTSTFLAVTTDASGNVYAAGTQFGSGMYSYGVQTATGTYGSGTNALLVKYDSTGTEQWARSVTAGIAQTSFAALAADSSGNIYAVGTQSGTGAYTYGGHSVSGAHGSNNAVIVKFDSAGNGIWGRSTAAASNVTSFAGVATDASGYVYAVGTQAGTAIVTYGTQSVSGAYLSNNALLVKYDSAGTAQWAVSTAAASNNSTYTSVATDGYGYVYCGGNQTNNGSFTYGSQSISSPYASGTNSLLVKYDTAGAAQWARTVATASNASVFKGLATDSGGNLYAGGSQQGNSAFVYGSQSATGTYTGSNISLVKYQ